MKNKEQKVGWKTKQSMGLVGGFYSAIVIFFTKHKLPDNPGDFIFKLMSHPVLPTIKIISCVGKLP
jgi:hypothetical protein